MVCSKTWDHDDVIKWKYFPRYWPFVRESPVNSTHKGQWWGALMFSLIFAWINGWVNNHESGDLRHHRVHYDVIVMLHLHFVSFSNTVITQVVNICHQTSQYNVCWWPGDARCQGISSHAIDQVLLECSGPNTIRVHWWDITTWKCLLHFWPFVMKIHW